MLPLDCAWKLGSEGVVGGMLTATFLAILFIPLFYVLISRLSREKEGNIAEDLKKEEEENNSEK